VSLPKNLHDEERTKITRGKRDREFAYAVDQIVDLITQRVDGIHLYTMNNPYVARKIYEAVHRLMTV
jgi:5,10-methylenetetrahydrofolate reductase